MTTSLPPRFESFAVPQGFRGPLAQLPLPEILRHLRATQATGILSLVSGGARKAIFVRDGRVVFGSSNLPNDRLGEILIRDGKITAEEYDASVKAIARGKRQGKVLVEMGAISPKDLWEGVQFQVREIVLSVFPWEDGQFHFEESSLPEKERITVDLDIVELLLIGMRRSDASGPVQSRFPEGMLVFERAGDPPEGILESYEEHVLGLVDGERSVLEICHDSEIGDNETMKVLYALQVDGDPQSQGTEGPGPRPGLRSRGHPVHGDQLVQPEVRAGLPPHGARGRADRRERSREISRRAPRDAQGRLRRNSAS